MTSAEHKALRIALVAGTSYLKAAEDVTKVLDDVDVYAILGDLEIAVARVEEVTESIKRTLDKAYQDS